MIRHNPSDMKSAFDHNVHVNWIQIFTAKNNSLRNLKDCDVDCLLNKILVYNEKAQLVQDNGEKIIS